MRGLALFVGAGAAYVAFRMVPPIGPVRLPLTLALPGWLQPLVCALLIESWGQTSAVTIEGNTSPSVEFAGAGFLRKRRLRYQIHSVRDWVGE